MSMIAIILALSAIMWYIIDNLKDKIWGGKSYSSYITIAVSAVAAFGLAFGYGLDVIYALGIAEAMTVFGKILTALAMMSGSAAVSELIELFRTKGVK
jgi:hypothetical protein